MGNGHWAACGHCCFAEITGLYIAVGAVRLELDKNCVWGMEWYLTQCHLYEYFNIKI